MVAKIWKKLLFFILIVACLFNIVTKLVKKVPYIKELQSSAQYLYNQEQNETKQNNTIK